MNSKKMKAIVCTRYGAPEVLQLTYVEKPNPKKNEVLIKIMASSLTTADSMMRRAEPYISRLFLGFTKPKNRITGTGFSGTIEAIGKDVKQFNIGDHVFGETGITFGANAEYVCLDELGVLACKPSTLSFEEAATLCDGPLTSLNFLKEVAAIKKGSQVLINGASGSLGTAAVQLAKYYGAKVTGVCGPNNVEMVKELGADEVIDYTITDFTKGDNSYDIIFDTVGKLSFSKCKSSLTSKGSYICPILGFSLLFQMILTSIKGMKKAKFSATGMLSPVMLKRLLSEICSIIQEGKLNVIIDKKFTFGQAVAAHRYIDTGHKRGNVVLVA
jgi:NADPH:quinone reductase-like Zn-dependent oxidoreductase